MPVRRDLGDFQTPSELVAEVLETLGPIGPRAGLVSWSRLVVEATSLTACSHFPSRRARFWPSRSGKSLPVGEIAVNRPRCRVALAWRSPTPTFSTST